MTAAVYRSGMPSLSIPQTQNTAPVLEFNCLYTHDLRKKQKKWHDGFLRFHTFNKRIMVYDVPRNYIGDMHWTAGEVLQEGDELMLEKGGAMVEVADAIGSTETDLTELRASRKKPVGKDASSPARAPQTPAVRVPSMTASRPGNALKHRSLNALLGTPKGLVGKAALPSKSPFELRHAGAENETWTEGRSPKRQRIERPPEKNVKQAASERTPLWARTSDAAKARQKAQSLQGQQRPQPGEIIELEDDAPTSDKFLPGFSSDALAPPSSSPKGRSSKQQAAPPARSSSPAFQTQKTPVAKPVECADLEDMSVRKSIPAAAPVRRVTPPNGETLDVDVNRRNLRVQQRRRSQSPKSLRPPAAARIEVAPARKSGAMLRIASSAPKKKTLVCQDQLAATIQRVQNSAPSKHNHDDNQGHVTKAKTQRQLLDERLKRVKSQSHTVATTVAVDVSRKPVGRGQGDCTGVEKSCDGQGHPPQSMVSTSSSFMDIDSILPQNVNQGPKLPGEYNESSEIDPSCASKDAVPTTEQMAEATTVEKAATAKPHDDHQETLLITDGAEPESHESAKAKSASRKKTGTGRKEIRQSAQSCFQPPADSVRQVAQAHATGSESGKTDAVPDEPVLATMTKEASEPGYGMTVATASMDLPRASSASDDEQAVAMRERTPGLPMRFTPSPQRRAQMAEQSGASRGASPSVSKEQPLTTNSGSGSNNTKTTQAFAKPALPASRQNHKKSTKQPIALNTATSGTSAVLLGRPFQAPKKAKAASKPASKPVTKIAPTDIAMTADPWSREAFDLFDWRPPGWDEEKWCFKDVKDALDETTKT